MSRKRVRDKTTYRLAVLYADVSGSTRIYEKYGDELARSDIHTCLHILSSIAAAHEGQTVKTIGDEIMCIFLDADKAALAATEMHAGLREAGKAGRFKTGPLRVKIGWHYGAAEKRGDDYIGEAPVMAQQVIKMAKAEEILTTGQGLGSLSIDIKNNAHLIDSVESEFGGGEVEVYSINWEEDESEITVISDEAIQAAARVDSVLELTYGDQHVKVDKHNTHCRIGRGEDNDLVVNGKFTSRHHAEIYYRHGRFHLADNSTNGTLLIDADAKIHRLRREEGILSDKGTICFGGEPSVDPGAAVQYGCLE